MTESFRRACIMGHNIAYTRSPKLHGYWLRALGLNGAYDVKDLGPADFASFFMSLRANGYVGGNVTKPYKEAAFRLVDRRDAAADAIGAVNTVWYEEAALIGGNTDWSGILLSLDDLHPGWEASTRNVLVLGAGGAARAAVYAFRHRRLNVAIVNRTAARARALAKEFEPGVIAADWDAREELLAETDLLINTTSLGMAGEPPLPLALERLKSGAIVYDIVYAPLETELLQTATRLGHRTVDGLSMLLYQAVPGFARWFGVTPKVTVELRALIEAELRRPAPVS